VVIVVSMPLAGPLQVPPPVGGGEAHPAGPGAPTCVDREVFSSNEFFSMITSRFFSITTSSPSPFVHFPSPSKKKIREKGKSCKIKNLWEARKFLRFSL
jgi:hypothetical protein